MDKDNLAVKRLFTTLTREGLEAIQSEAQQQTLSALLLTFVGIFLTFAGLITILLKLRCIARCRFLLVTRHLESIWLQRHLSGSSKPQKLTVENHCLTSQKGEHASRFSLGNYALNNSARHKIKIS